MPLEGFAVPKGPSIIQIIWGEMDAAYERLIADGAIGSKSGRISGLASALFAPVPRRRWPPSRSRV